MKKIFFGFGIIQLFFLNPAFASVEGHWFYYKKIFQGNEMPEPPEATLRLHFEFYPDGTDRLYWWHEGENDLCSRNGKYFLENEVIVDEVTLVSPDNHESCAKDSDMVVGKISRTPFKIVNGDLQTEIPLGDETLLYVWKKISPDPEIRTAH